MKFEVNETKMKAFGHDLFAFDNEPYHQIRLTCSIHNNYLTNELSKNFRKSILKYC